jgi:hypothetical protein
MMQTQPAIKFADAEKVPRVVLPVIRWQDRSIYLKQLQKCLQLSVISERSAEQYQITTRRRVANGRQPTSDAGQDQCPLWANSGHRQPYLLYRRGE